MKRSDKLMASRSQSNQTTGNQTMWHLCVQYANGTERVLQSYRNRETALRRVDAIYSNGYPLHIAYLVRQAA